MDADQIEQVCTALAKGASHDGLYALQGVYDVSPEQAQYSLRRAIWLINDETGVDSGNRADEELDE